MKMNKKPAFLLGLLSLYVILQFLWWGYLLIHGTLGKAAMVIGEGAFFLVVLIIGIWRIGKSIQKEMKISAQQSNFLLSVTHELKTPIASIQLILQTLKKRELNDDQKNTFIDQALQENKRSELLIENLLQAARLDGKEILVIKREININEVVGNIIEEFKKNYSSCNFNFEQGPVHSLIVDPFMFEMVLRILIENAIKYGGNQIDINIQKNLNKMEIQIKDNGSGISEKDRPYIFDKFYRSGDENIRSRKGTGLGLFIAQEYIQLNNGQIFYFPNVPNGAVFTIRVTQ